MCLNEVDRKDIYQNRVSGIFDIHRHILSLILHNQYSIAQFDQNKLILKIVSINNYSQYPMTLLVLTLQPCSGPFRKLLGLTPFMESPPVVFF